MDQGLGARPEEVVQILRFKHLQHSGGVGCPRRDHKALVIGLGKCGQFRKPHAPDPPTDQVDSADIVGEDLRDQSFRGVNREPHHGVGHFCVVGGEKLGLKSLAEPLLKLGLKPGPVVQPKFGQQLLLICPLHMADQQPETLQCVNIFHQLTFQIGVCDILPAGQRESGKDFSENV